MRYRLSVSRCTKNSGQSSTESDMEKWYLCPNGLKNSFSSKRMVKTELPNERPSTDFNFLLTHHHTIHKNKHNPESIGNGANDNSVFTQILRYILQTLPCSGFAFKGVMQWELNIHQVEKGVGWQDASYTRLGDTKVHIISTLVICTNIIAIYSKKSSWKSTSHGVVPLFRLSYRNLGNVCNG